MQDNYTKMHKMYTKSIHNHAKVMYILYTSFFSCVPNVCMYLKNSQFSIEETFLIKSIQKVYISVDI